MDHALYFSKAIKARAFSHHPTTQTGAVLVSADEQTVFVEANRIPDRLQPKPSRLAPEERSYWIRHAEAGCLDRAAEAGMVCAGSTMYSLWLPCMPCALQMAGSGVSRVVVSRKWHDILRGTSNQEKWAPHFARLGSFETLELTFEWYEGDI